MCFGFLARGANGRLREFARVRMAGVFFGLGCVLFLMYSYPSLMLSLAMIYQFGTLKPIPKDIVLGPSFTLEWGCLESVREFRISLLIFLNLFDHCPSQSIEECSCLYQWYPKCLDLDSGPKHTQLMCDE